MSSAGLHRVDIAQSTWLDPTQNPPEERPYGSKALINACKEHRYLPVFSKRTALRKEMYDQVASRWSSLGLAGQAPAVRAYESDQPLVFHEQGSFEPGAAQRASDAPPAPRM